MYWMTSLTAIIITQLIMAGVVMFLGMKLLEDNKQSKYWRGIGGLLALISCLSVYQIWFIIYVFY